jgi:predicted  nucleic acid-binding Zn-ribbon protein
MFSTGDMSGAMMLSNQLEIYRWEDHFRRMREQDGLAAQNAALRSELARLGAAYNELARNFKHFASAALEMEKQTGERIAQLEREVSELRDSKAKSEAEMQEFVRESIRRDFEGV